MSAKPHSTLASIFYGPVLVCLSFLLTIWVGRHYSERVAVVRIIDQLGGGGVSEELYDGTYEKSFLPAEHQFLFFGDTTRPTKSAQQRAIWEKNPDNKVYYANYIRELVGDYMDEEYGVPPAVSIDELEKEIRQGEKIDPDNAFYNYIWAAILFKRGAEWKSNPEEDRDEWVINDPTLLDSAIVELRKATAKPYYRRYHDELNEERLGFFPETRRIEHRLVKLTFLASLRLPELGLVRDLFKAIPQYVESNELSESEASQLLDTWQSFLTQSIPDAYCLIDVLVLNAVAKLSGEKVAEVYESMEELESADNTREYAGKLSQPITQWKDNRADMPFGGDSIDSMKLGILASMLLPSLGEPITGEMLAPGNHVERVAFLEQMIAHSMLVLLVLLIIFAFILRSICQLAANGRAPNLFIPSLKDFLRIFGFGVLLPVAFYYVYTRHSGISSYENSLRDYRSFLEVGLFVVTCFAVSTWLGMGFIRQRCEKLGISVPQSIRPLWGGLFFGALLVSWILCILVRPLFGHIRLMDDILLGLMSGLGLIFLVICIIVFFKGVILRKEFGSYYGSLARSLMPIWACVILFIGGLGIPWLHQQETALLKKDTLLASSIGGFTAVEERVTHRLRDGMADALKTNQD